MLYEYTWEFVAYMMITGEGCSSPDIWLEIFNKNIGIEDMILTICYKEAIKQTEINLQQYHPPGPNTKKIHYISYISSYLKNSYAHQVIDMWFYHRFLGPHDGKNLGPGWHILPVAKQ